MRATATTRTLLPALAALGLAVAACTESTAPAPPDNPAGGGPELAVVTFGIERLGDPLLNVTGRAVNDAGQVAGTTGANSPASHAYIWSGGMMQALPGVEPLFTSAGIDLNDFGTTAGLVFTSLTSAAAAVWDGGVVTPLASHYTDGSALAIAINNTGRIVGADVLFGSPEVGLVWRDRNDADPIVLQTPAGELAHPLDINDAGSIVGWIEASLGNSYAAVWPSATAAPQALKGIDGPECKGTKSVANAINQRGEIVGACDVGDQVHAALWTSAAAVPIDLGPGFANGINELGQIVGSLGDPTRPSLIMLEAGSYRRFDIGTPNGVNFLHLTDLNNTGKAVGFSTSGTKDDELGAFAIQIPLRAAIDLVPGSSTNAIRRDGRGVVSVAILGSRWFRASDVNPAALTLGIDDGVDTPVLRRRGLPVARITDLNRDGFPDLVADFDKRELMNRGDLPTGSAVLVLLGLMRDGSHLRGADGVVAN